MLLTCKLCKIHNNEIALSNRKEALKISVQISPI
jgi:hypothetical protein